MSGACIWVLVVEDDPSLREAIGDTLELAGRPIVAVDGGESALPVLARKSVFHRRQRCAHDADGRHHLLKEIRARLPHLPVVLMTAYADVDKAVEAMRAGACDFRSSLSSRRPCSPTSTNTVALDQWTRMGVMASDPASRELFAIAQRVAQTDATVLLHRRKALARKWSLASFIAIRRARPAFRCHQLRSHSG